VRQDIAEIGTLASLHPGLQRFLFVHLAHQLVAEGIVWLLFTATPEVANGLRRLGLEPQPITPADPARVGDKQHLWGRYYQHRLGHGRRSSPRDAHASDSGRLNYPPFCTGGVTCTPCLTR
jgi:hypothetical protein